MMPISCVMPTTAARRWCIPLAIECFQKQTYPYPELMIVFDGPGSIRDLVPVQNNIKLIKLFGDRSLGEKFNACVHHATHDHIALWADDDWHAPWRLEKTAAAFSPASIVGTHKMLFHDLGKEKTWLYDWNAPPPVGFKNFRRDDFLLGGTLAFRRSVWQETPFPDVNSAVDNGFVAEALKKNITTSLPYPEMYVAMTHGDNTRGELEPNWPFESWDGDINEVMQGSYAAYRSAYENRLHRDV